MNKIVSSVEPSSVKVVGSELKEGKLIIQIQEVVPFPVKTELPILADDPEFFPDCNLGSLFIPATKHGKNGDLVWTSKWGNYQPHILESCSFEGPDSSDGSLYEPGMAGFHDGTGSIAYWPYSIPRNSEAAKRIRKSYEAQHDCTDLRVRVVLALLIG